MNQFDEELKRKMAGKSYEYTPKAWFSFVRHSGMPMLGIGAKIAFISVGIGLSGLIAFFTLRPTSEEIPPTTSENEVVFQENEITPVVVDTIYNIVKEKQETVHPTQTAVNIPAKAKTDEENPAEENKIEATETAPVAKKITKREYYGRPLNILVDTISSNDFPDEKPRPADEIW